MRSLLLDLHDAVRGLRRDRAYSAAAILLLALTIGSTTAVFSIVDGVLLKPLTYPESDRLVTTREVWQQFVDRAPTLPVNERHFEYWRKHAQSFAGMAQYLPLAASITSGGEAARITVVPASGSLFDVLRAPAAVGRTLAPEDERSDHPDVVMLGDTIWRQRFGANPEVVGASIILDGKPFTVVGVLPPGFRLPAGDQLLATIDAVVALRVNVGWVGDHNDFGVARLRDGVTIEHARAELEVLQRQVSDIASAEAKEPVTLSAVVTPLAESVVGQARRGLLLLFAAVAAVLLIACSNLANLSFARTLGRTRDAAIRSALGASRFRLIRRAVLEQLTLSLTATALGIWVATAALALFVRTAPVNLPRIDEIALDGRALLFAATLAVLTGVLVAILPAWRTASRDAQAALRTGGAAAGVDRGGLRARSALMALQVAVSVTLLATSALLVASLFRVLGIEPGFASGRVVTVPITLPTARYAADPARIAVYDRILAATSTVPSVVSVSMTSLLPMRGEGQVNFIVPDGRVVSRSEQASANFRFVGPAFFSTLQISIIRGRPFTDADRDLARAMPVVISEPVADRLWPGQDPIGQGLSRGIDGEPGFEVVGVAADARTTSMEQTPPLMVYLPYWWRSRPSTSLLVKTVADPRIVMADLRRVLRDIDAEIAVGEMRPLDDLLEAAVAGRRYQAELFVAFGLIALAVAAVGVYAVTAYSLSRRRGEMNLRVALGARHADVFRMILRQASGPIAAGVLAGVAGALAAGGAVASLLFEVRARDPIIIAAATLLVAGVALLSAVTAARSGLSLNPAAALRES
jgi:putative ABC transport system permease protein